MQLLCHDCSSLRLLWDVCCNLGYLLSSLGTVADFITDAVMKAAFFTFLISLSSFTDRMSAKALATSVVGNSDSDNALLHLSVRLPAGLSCTDLSASRHGADKHACDLIVLCTHLWQSTNAAICLFEDLYHLLNVRSAIISLGSFKELQLDVDLFLGRSYQLMKKRSCNSQQ